MAFVTKTVNLSQKHKNLQGGVPCNSGVSRNCSELCPGRAATVNGPEGSPARPFPKAATLTFMPQSTLLEKFGSALDGIEPMNVIEQWFYYFRNMKKFSTLAGGPKILDERYRPLIEASKTRRFTDQEWKEYIKAMYTEKELENITKPYFEDGLRKGIEQGIAQGVAQGVAQSKAEIAKAMLAKGYDPATVQELTGLTVEEIAALGVK